MTTSERAGRFDHLLSEAVRRTVGQDGYGSWRAISAPDAVSLSFGFPYPDSFPNDDLLAAAEAVFEEEGDRVLQYGGGEYATRLQEFIAERARERGIDAESEEVVLTNGATHALDVVAHAFLDPGDEVVVEAPTFMGSLKLFQNYDARVTGIPVDEHGLDVDALATHLHERRAADGGTPTLCYTIPNFQNPTGATLPRRRRERLLELAEEFDFVVVADDAYGELRYDGEDEPPLRALDDSGRVVRIGTFSKTIAPGVRTGWVVADEDIREPVDRVAAGGTNTFTQSVLGKYCEAGRFETNLADFRVAYERRRDHLLDCLDEHMPPETDWTRPDGGFFVWITLPDGITADDLLPVAAEEGVTYLPGSLFYPDGEPCAALRVSFSHVSFEELDQGVAALARAVRSYDDADAD